MRLLTSRPMESSTISPMVEAHSSGFTMAMNSLIWVVGITESHLLGLRTSSTLSKSLLDVTEHQIEILAIHMHALERHTND